VPGVKTFVTIKLYNVCCIFACNWCDNTDIADVAQLTSFIRVVDENSSIAEMLSELAAQQRLKILILSLERWQGSESLSA